MANLGQNYNRADMPEDDFAPMAAGTYQAIISASEMTPYKNGNGQYLKVTYDIIDGASAGRKIFDNMNLFHPTSAQAKEISWQTMGKIMDAVGILNVNDSQELHNKPITIEVEIDGQYNRIKAWKPSGAVAQPTAAPTPSPSFGAVAPAGANFEPPF